MLELEAGMSYASNFTNQVNDLADWFQKSNGEPFNPRETSAMANKDLAYYMALPYTIQIRHIQDEGDLLLR
ncbi:hypothetical protein [Laceyella putida]|uniref:Uncharacterized protein n=1 Tax=Laceyella putida TaxID=110101 RepID=A0ABW2RLJ2_9BACL